MSTILHMNEVDQRALVTIGDMVQYAEEAYKIYGNY